MNRDIELPEDVRVMVDAFYHKVQKDDLLSPIFNHTAEVNWQHHLPAMYTFWESILLGTDRYQGRPFPKHAVLSLTTEHFTRWLNLFENALDENFSGSKADEAKGRARAIALVFMGKLGLLD